MNVFVVFGIHSQYCGSVDDIGQVYEKHT